jgi:hypothetical protein
MSKPKNTESINRNKKLFLEKYPEHGTVGATMKAIGLKRRETFYDWCKDDPQFKKIYQTELLPNRRDVVVSTVFKMATAQRNVAVCPVCEGTGKYDGNKNCHGCRGRGWVEVHADSTQLTAAFGFLKATAHIDKGFDRLVFAEKYQVTGEGGGPLEVDIDVKGKLISLLNRLAARGGEAKSDTKPEPEGSGGAPL